ncbi:S1 RNA-binding domain-containing protein [Thiohalocapsa marina]|uniref:S1 RNA-binding domain-containing protein n=1 Tax=Thiohalocapsa marina TaxID=424902 RepID=A0A5M8FUB6_9GAMM|nr:S1 RNA-binding domain-containing protein [Thiohalocapsa marina]KAA6187418.1 S1 RNA-binding domain-containing protein [Thiohalocapsa marina]
MTDDNDFEALLRELEKTEQAMAAALPKVGEQVKGTIISVGSEQVFVDLGGKAEASMDVEHLRGDDGTLSLQAGDELSGIVTSVDVETGAVILGTRQGKQLHGSAELESAYRQGLSVEGHITGTTKGGLEVQIAGHRAFCPASQADIRFVEDLSTLVGERCAFRITRFEGGRRLNLVVSRRAPLEQEQAARAAEVRAQLQEGAVLSGTVTGMKEFGAFIDLGGVEGMVHVSELALGRVRHPEEVLQIGQQVEVVVLRVEQTGNPKRPEKIALSIRALAKDPWSDVAARYPVGTRVAGRVTRTQPFGAFVELEPGVEGMVHISELGAGRRVDHPDEVVSTGQSVQATVLAVEPERRRIGLSLDPDSAPVDAAAFAAGPSAARQDDAAGPGRGTFGDLLQAQIGRGDRR